MNSIETINKYKDLEWTAKQNELIDLAFGNIDNLLFLCEQEGDMVKYNEIKPAHDILHKLILASSIKELLDIPTLIFEDENFKITKSIEYPNHILIKSDLPFIKGFYINKTFHEINFNNSFKGCTFRVNEKGFIDDYFTKEISEEIEILSNSLNIDSYMIKNKIRSIILNKLL